MPWTTLTPIIVWFVLFVPFTIYMWVTEINNRVKYILLILAYAAFNLYFVLVVNFAMLNYWLRALPVIAFVVFVGRFLVLPRHRRWLPDRNKRRWLTPILFSLAVILLMVYPDYTALLSYRFSDAVYKPMLAQWPLQTGLYVIVNGVNGIEIIVQPDTVDGNVISGNGKNHGQGDKIEIPCGIVISK